jgi:hemerythrin
MSTIDSDQHSKETSFFCTDGTDLVQSILDCHPSYQRRRKAHANFIRKIIGIRWKKNQVSFLVPSRLLPLSFSFPYANIDHEDAVLPTELKHSSMVVDNPQCFCFI